MLDKLGEQRAVVRRAAGRRNCAHGGGVHHQRRAGRPEHDPHRHLRLALPALARGTSTRPVCRSAASLLEYAAGQLSSIEINGSPFLPATAVELGEVAGRGARRLRLRREGRTFHHAHEAAARRRERGGELLRLRHPRAGPKLGDLRQLPATFAYDEQVLTDFCALLPRTTAEAAELARRHDDRLTGDRLWTGQVSADRPIRHALEPRHPSFAAEGAVAQLLRGRRQPGGGRAAGPKWPRFEQATGPLVYVRLHGDTSSTPAATPTQHSTTGPRSCGGGRPMGETPTSTSTTTSRDTPRTTRES